METQHPLTNDSNKCPNVRCAAWSREQNRHELRPKRHLYYTLYTLAARLGMIEMIEGLYRYRCMLLSGSINHFPVYDKQQLQSIFKIR